MRNLTACATITALLLSAATASAHHAFSRDFDQSKPVTLSGTVTKVQWTSPHVMTYIDVKDSNGKVTNWKVELGSPAQLTKAGWTRDMLKVGEMVNLQGWQAKNGTNFANAEEVTMANGQKLSAASSHDSIKREGVATSGSKTPKPESNEKTTPPKSTAPKY
jgi:DNA/RNA endonuclease YhcR with UshA esterase domain